LTKVLAIITAAVLIETEEGKSISELDSLLDGKMKSCEQIYDYVVDEYVLAPTDEDLVKALEEEKTWRNH
jgi:hypothetical protein